MSSPVLTSIDPAVFGARVKEGRALKEARLGRPYTQVDLARDVAKGRTTVIAWEGGTSVPPVHTRVRIAAALGVGVAWLEGRSDTPGEPPNSEQDVSAQLEELASRPNPREYPRRMRVIASHFVADVETELELDDEERAYLHNAVTSGSAASMWGRGYVDGPVGDAMIRRFERHLERVRESLRDHVQLRRQLGDDSE